MFESIGIYLILNHIVVLFSRGKEQMTKDDPLTISVPEAGRRYFNLSRNASYAAAERGEIPVIRIGRLLRVPVRAMERKLDNASERHGGAEAA
jgi:hypothetical protein